MRPCDYHLIEMIYEDTSAERVYVNGDSELTGNYITATRTWRVMAPSLEVAKAIWESTRGHVDSWKVLKWHDCGTFDLLVWAEGF